jgi:hypothetical protein
MAEFTEYLERDTLPPHQQSVHPPVKPPLANQDEPPAEHGVNSVCTLCGGNGWVYSTGYICGLGKDRRVTRCLCRGRRAEVKKSATLPDFKSIALGENDNA